MFIDAIVYLFCAQRLLEFLSLSGYVNKIKRVFVD